jgi:hypothetical protein
MDYFQRGDPRESTRWIAIRHDPEPATPVSDPHLTAGHRSIDKFKEFLPKLRDRDFHECTSDSVPYVHLFQASRYGQPCQKTPRDGLRIFQKPLKAPELVKQPPRNPNFTLELLSKVAS